MDQLSQMLSAFDPIQRKFQDIAVLRCPSTFGAPETMAIARDGVAWVFYSSSQLFLVNVSTGDCRSTAFDSSQIMHALFGMGSGFSADLPDGATETLFLALSQERQFARLDRQTLRIERFGALDGAAELTGTSTAELWAYVSDRSFVAQVDKTNGALFDPLPLPQLGNAGGFAFAYWGGSFWIFQAATAGTDTSIYRLDRESGAVETVASHTGRIIVGAGASSCAPFAPVD